MKLTVIGLGKLGLCIACTLAKQYKVIGIDNNTTHINLLRNGVNTIKETNLDLWFDSYRHNITFTNEYKNLSNLIFVVVPTPSMPNNIFTSEFIENALENIQEEKTIIIVSTLMPGETARLQKKYPHLNLIYNPTFIALGTVIKNFLMPDFILIGSDNQKGIPNLLRIYNKICLIKPTFSILSTLEAEIAKLALNCYITTKITFANQIGNLCHRLNISPQRILNSIGQDKRIGNAYFKAGLGYGGPCFSRDNLAMSAYMRKYKIEPLLPETIHNLNEKQIDEFVERIEQLEPKSVGFEGFSYKKGTTNQDNSQLVAINHKLNKKGFKTILGKGDININWEGIYK